MDRFRTILGLMASLLLTMPSNAMAQGESPSGSVLNILLLVIVAYVLVRMFRRRMGGGDKGNTPRPGNWTSREKDEETVNGKERGGKVIRPMDRHEAARQMWGHLESNKAEAAPVERPEVSGRSGFDEAEFLEGAKVFFSRFKQVETDDDLDTLKDFLSDEVYADAVLDMQRRRTSVRTEVMLLEAKVMEVKTEGETTRASVFYDGQLRTGEHGDKTEHVRAVWEFSRDDTVDNGLWKLEKINKVDQ